jgi:hypothetical protein
MKAWRRTSRDSGTASAGPDCGDQPSEVFISQPGGGDLELTWNWPFGSASGIIEESKQTDPDTWVLVDGGVTLADDDKVWTSSFSLGDMVRARIRRVGSDAGCAVVTGYVELV